VTNAIDVFVDKAAIKAANHFTRRSFIGRVAGATTAVATAGLAVDVPDAMAVCSGMSVTCNVLYGFNHCSENTCYDGSWVVPPGHCDHVSQCGSHRTRWRDCCAPPSCTSHWVSGYRSCHYNCIYNGGGCNGYPRVRCRFWACGS
jgi:hypothetical protein